MYRIYLLTFDSGFEYNMNLKGEYCEHTDIFTTTN